MLLRSAFRAQRVSVALQKAQPRFSPQLACRAAGSSSNAPSKPDIKELAANARIRIADEEVKDYEPKINSIIEWFGELQHVNISSVSPAMHGTQEATPLREDVPITCLEREDLLAMAPSAERQMFRVPRTATGADADVAAAPASSDSTNAQAAEQPSTSSKGGSEKGSGESGPSEQQQLDSLLVMDFRVGKILSCEKHPEADSLYVEQIDVGEPEPRTIVSGLVKYVPIEQMQDRMVVVVANLKPRNMRKIKSHGMVLAASNAEHTAVEPVVPPAGAAPGERVTFADLQLQPPAVPNAVEKKKLWEYAAPGLRTTPNGVAAWKGKAMMTSAGPVQASSLPDARIA